MQTKDCNCNDCKQERRRIELIKLGMHPAKAFLKATLERERAHKRERIFCANCCFYRPLDGAQLDGDDWICKRCAKLV
jgi:hypothetical protein